LSVMVEFLLMIARCGGSNSEQGQAAPPLQAEFFSIALPRVFVIRSAISHRPSCKVRQQTVQFVRIWI
jgi:hypothetical protein